MSKECTKLEYAHTSIPSSVSAVVVTYRQEEDLRRCLGSLIGLSRLSEIIVVNNEPGDGTRDWVEHEFSGVRVLEDSLDDGYAGGINRGSRLATSTFLWILNPDTYIDPRALDAFLDAERKRPNALYTAKLLLPDGRVNACGNIMHFAGLTTCLGFGEPAEKFKGLFPVPLLSGACIFVSRRIWEELGGFNASFFLYMDDAELSLRARLRGYELWCAADAVVEHAYMLKLTSEKFYYLERNRLTTILTVYKPPTLLRLLPGLLLMEVLTWIYVISRGREFIRAQFRKYLWLGTQRHNIVRRHQALQEHRVASDAELLAHMSCAVPYGQLMRNSKLATVVSKVSTLLFSLVSPFPVRQQRRRMVE